jgi:hypothetical protein
MTQYGCWNREPFATHQISHGVDSQTGQIIRTEVANRMTPDCQFTKTELGKVDARCAGCKHKADSGNA